MNPYTYKAISLEHHNKKLEDIFQLEKKMIMSHRKENESLEEKKVWGIPG